MRLKHTKTNFDYLKGLNREETALFLKKICLQAVSDYLDGVRYCDLGYYADWLKKEVKDD